MIHRIVHITLAFLLFVSSAGFVVNKHYCQNELKSVAFFQKAKPCHQPKSMKNCPMHSAEKDQDTQPSKGCCDDQSDYLHSDSDQLAQGTNISLELTPKLVGLISAVPALNPPTTDLGVLHYLNYKPPLIVRDFTVSLQTFLC